MLRDENVFRITGPFWRESTGDQWFSHKGSVMRGAIILKKLLNQQSIAVALLWCICN